MKPVARIVALALFAAIVLVAAWLATRSRAGGDAAGAVRPAASDVERSAPVLPAELVSEPSDSRAEAPRTTAATADAEPAAELALVVLDALGAAVAGADVFVLDAGQGLQSAATDSNGRARVAPRAGQGSVFVLRSAWVPQRFEVDLAAGERTVALASGAEVSGAVTVEGRAPREPLKLRLTSAGAPFAELELPAELRERLGTQRLDLACATDERGTFAFGGLASEWRGALVLPAGHCLRTEMRKEYRVELERPASGLRFDLERLPRLVGRVVDEQGTALPAGTRVQMLIEWSSGHTMATSEKSAAEGRFEFVLRESEFRSVELTAETGTGRGDLVRARAELGEDLDVGVLVLRAKRELRFRALDPDGHPVGGARGKLLGDSAWEKTAADGVGRVQSIAEGEARLRVTAEGFWAAEVAVVVPSEATVDVALSRANRLDLSVVGPDGQPTAGVCVQLATEGRPLFPDNGDWSVDDSMLALLVGSQVRSGRTHRTGSPQSSEGSIVIAPDARGRVTLQCLVPGHPIAVSLVDTLKHTLREFEIAPLGPEEVREVELALLQTLHALTGTVTEANGHPLAGVGLRANSAPGEAHTTSDSAGRFELSGISASPVFVTAELAGFARKIVEVALVGDSTELAIVLERGRRLAVEVVDERGRAVGGGRVEATAQNNAGQWYARAISDGSFELRDLPREEVVLVLKLGGRSYELRSAPGDEVARFAVPVHGRIAVTVSVPAGREAAEFVVRLRALDEGVASQVRRADSAAQEVIDFGPLVPGEYEVQLARQVYGEPAEPAGEPRRVRVVADATARVAVP